ncbi:MAG TPA: NUDIX domain-containing protein [Nocardioidaceae bacterium]|nr:NUDIX domain-containing protein [Nocardioidaceae bacterium]
MSVLVMGAAIIRDGRVLVARRTTPAELAGGWEFPGGKVEPGEDVEAAVVREIHEELGCEVTVTGHLDGEVTIRDGYVLRVALATLDSGEPVPHEHDAVRWLGPEDLDDVTWLAPDLPFLAELRELLLDGRRLDGGNVAGAVKIGRTVRRTPGPWTTAVHSLLDHLAERGLPHVPRALEADARGREVLTFLPGHIVDVDLELLSKPQLESLVSWTRRFHDAVAGFTHPGPWRFFGVADPQIVAHNDLAPYNVCFEGDHLVGVFDWDLAGPSTALMELAHLAWNCVPLFRDIGPSSAAHRLTVIADTYGRFTAREILDAVPPRVQLAVDGIRIAAGGGDEGMRRLMSTGEPGHTEQRLADLRERIPSIEKELG